MASVIKGLLQSQTPILLTRRFRGKINIQRPRPPHFKRKLLIELCKPVYGPPKYTLPELVLCSKENDKSKVLEKDNPFERILARECLEWFNTSKMVVFIHLNSITMEEKLPVFADLKRNNMHLRTYGKKIMSMATKGTRYEVVNQLFTSHQNLLFGQPDSVGKMFRILKRAPQLVIMAGIINDQLLSKNELVEYSCLPDLQTAQSQLCSVLESAATTLVGQLNQSQQTLVSHLDKHVELQQTEGKENETDS